MLLLDSKFVQAFPYILVHFWWTQLLDRALLSWVLHKRFVFCNKTRITILILGWSHIFGWVSWFETIAMIGSERIARRRTYFLLNLVTKNRLGNWGQTIFLSKSKWHLLWSFIFIHHYGFCLFICNLDIQFQNCLPRLVLNRKTVILHDSS